MTIQIDATPEVAADPRDLQIASLQNDLESLRMRLNGALKAHRDDIALIGERLIEEAERRDWCSAFDQAVSDLNDRLTVPLPMRERSFTVEVSGVLRVPFTYTLQVTLEGGGDFDDALRDAVRDAMGDVSASDVNEDPYGAEITDWEVDDWSED